MKIFNWVHRRFNNKAENAKKNDVDDEQFQLENSFERWGGGILTIGTLGYDPLKDQNQQTNDFFYTEEDEDEDDDVDGYDDDDDDDDDETSEFADEELDQVESEDEEQNPLVLRYNAEGEENWNDDDDEEDRDHHHQLQFGYEYMMMKKQERTTLADLFSADSDKDADHRIVNVMKKQSIMKKLQPQLLKDKSNRKHALSFANNLTAHKFNQLMRRMLKRKIHPDVGPINSKAEDLPAPAPVNNKCRTTDDHALLLPTLQEAKI